MAEIRNTMHSDHFRSGGRIDEEEMGVMGGLGQMMGREKDMSEMDEVNGRDEGDGKN